jgi:hypothetical protein
MSEDVSNLPPILRIRKTGEDITSSKKRPVRKKQVKMRRFTLDTTVGTVEGIMFSDGTVVVRWPGPTASTVVWKNLADFISISVKPTPSRSITWLD